MYTKKVQVVCDLTTKNITDNEAMEAELMRLPCVSYVDNGEITFEYNSFNQALDFLAKNKATAMAIVEKFTQDQLVSLCDTCELIAADCGNERETIGNTNHVIKCASYHKQDRLVNLCDTCMSDYQDCGGVGMEYGDGPGEDNVIVCFAYTIKD